MRAWPDSIERCAIVLGVPVVDPVAAGVRFAAMLIEMKLQTSKWLTYRYPEVKAGGWNDLQK